MKQRILFFILLSIFCFRLSTASAQDAVFSQDIHGIQFSQSGNQWAYPVMNIGSQNALQLDFDDFNTNPKDYYYTYQLCDADWNIVPLSTFDYIKGFTQNRITKYTVSSYAKMKFIHYSVSLPQQSMLPTKSGNYILKVFADGDTSQTIFTRRFLITGSKVTVSAQVQQPFDNAKLNTYHKIQFSIDVSHLQISNPQQQLKVVVLQNYRWDNAITNLQPAFMRANVYEYNGERDVLFQAGKEFHWADLQSFRYQSEHVESIDASQTPFDVNVKIDKSRMNDDYLPYQDYNGFFNIAATEQIDAWSQGDYARVHFYYRTSDGKPYSDKEVYIVGQINNYTYDNSSKLQFDVQKGLYEATLLLKQGYYNYMYVTKDANNPNSVPDFTFTEGNNWLTENNYTILVYYQSFSERVPELVACTTISSKQQ